MFLGLCCDNKIPEVVCFTQKTALFISQFWRPKSMMVASALLLVRVLCYSRSRWKAGGHVGACDLVEGDPTPRVLTCSCKKGFSLFQRVLCPWPAIEVSAHRLLVANNLKLLHQVIFLSFDFSQGTISNSSEIPGCIQMAWGICLPSLSVWDIRH